MHKEQKAERTTKRISLSQNSYKYLKKMAIDLEIDNDGKFTPEVLGICLDEMVKRLNDEKRHIEE